MAGMQVFTSSGNFTPVIGVTYKIICVGGGAGGGGGGSGAANTITSALTLPSLGGMCGLGFGAGATTGTSIFGERTMISSCAFFATIGSVFSTFGFSTIISCFCNSLFAIFRK